VSADGLRSAAEAYLTAEDEPAYSWVIESQAARDEGRPNREVERMDRISAARRSLRAALQAEPAPTVRMGTVRPRPGVDFTGYAEPAPRDEFIECGIDGCTFAVERGEGRTMALHKSEDHEPAPTPPVSPPSPRIKSRRRSVSDDELDHPEGTVAAAQRLLAKGFGMNAHQVDSITLREIDAYAEDPVMCVTLIPLGGTIGIVIHRSDAVPKDKDIVFVAASALGNTLPALGFTAVRAAVLVVAPQDATHESAR